ncbi:MAG: sigma-70 family RNA polymerase sigma factor [Alphaproteobacteria bacterium]|nr:sigma-70 family RNA polymerase sigma factor [Alphaproteobacteria bacterium]
MSEARKKQLTEASDEELIDHVLAHNESAAEALVRRYGGWMLSVALRLTRDRALAEDCVQDAFANVFSRLSSFERRSSLKTWLYRIVVNAALMKLRGQRARKESDLETLLPNFDVNECRIEEPWRRILTPEQIVGSEHMRSLVLHKVNELPESYRSVLLLRDIEEMTTAEVAATLEISPANVKVRLHRARAALKRLLEPLLRGEVQ